jgi:uncharacterized membrane-anchored protein
MTARLLLLYPILVLGLVTAQQSWRQASGVQLELPIQGYDPRDLISGHYLVYTIDYGIEKPCEAAVPLPRADQTAVNKAMANREPELKLCLRDSCSVWIRGRCEGTRFVAGIERFFIPEEHARQIETLIQGKPSSLVVSIGPDGRAAIVDLKIDGQPWQDALASQSSGE